MSIPLETGLRADDMGMTNDPGSTAQTKTEKFFYDNNIVKMFAYATILWGIVGMLAGILAAFQLVFPALNFGLAHTS
jgi:cbb3-type cytochrome oxidase subunit 1